MWDTVPGYLVVGTLGGALQGYPAIFSARDVLPKKINMEAKPGAQRAVAD